VSDLVAPAPEVASHGPCAVCGAPGRRSFFANQPFIARRRVEADGTVVEVNDPVPPISVCMEHWVEVLSERLPVGYCDDERCRRWGPEGAASPCGAPYGDLPEPPAHEHEHGEGATDDGRGA